MTAHRLIGIAAIAGCLSVVAVSGQTAAPPQAPAAPAAPEGNADNGKTLYVKYGCQTCHALEGQGAPTSGPRIGPNPVPLAGFTRYIRAPKGQMSPYTAKVVPDAEVADIHAYLRTRPRPAAATVLPPQ